MKYSTLMYALVSLSLSAAGCASSSPGARAADASREGHACASPGAYVVTTDTSVRSGGARGDETVVAGVDPLVLQGRGVASTTAGVPVRATARTEFSRGGVPACD
jgi:hypothetical protein